MYYIHLYSRCKYLLVIDSIGLCMPFDHQFCLVALCSSIQFVLYSKYSLTPYWSLSHTCFNYIVCISTFIEFFHSSQVKASDSVLGIDIAFQPKRKFLLDEDLEKNELLCILLSIRDLHIQVSSNYTICKL